MPPAALPDSNSASGDAAREKLEKALSDLAKGAKDLGLALPSLEEAMAALAASQTDQVLRNLAATETELEKLQAMAKALAQLQKQSEKLGKDLAEQFGTAKPRRPNRLWKRWSSSSAQPTSHPKH